MKWYEKDQEEGRKTKEEQEKKEEQDRPKKDNWKRADGPSHQEDSDQGEGEASVLEWCKEYPRSLGSDGRGS